MKINIDENIYKYLQPKHKNILRVKLCLLDKSFIFQKIIKCIRSDLEITRSGMNYKHALGQVVVDGNSSGKYLNKRIYIGESGKHIFDKNEYYTVLLLAKQTEISERLVLDYAYNSAFYYPENSNVMGIIVDNAHSIQEQGIYIKYSPHIDMIGSINYAKKIYRYLPKEKSMSIKGFRETVDNNLMSKENGLLNPAKFQKNIKLPQKYRNKDMGQTTRDQLTSYLITNEFVKEIYEAGKYHKKQADYLKYTLIVILAVKQMMPYEKILDPLSQ